MNGSNTKNINGFHFKNEKKNDYVKNWFLTEKVFYICSNSIFLIISFSRLEGPLYAKSIFLKSLWFSFKFNFKLR